MPKAAARPTTEPAIVSAGRIEVAKPLFSHTRTTGTRHSAARLKVSRTTPWLTAPSPK